MHPLFSFFRVYAPFLFFPLWVYTFLCPSWFMRPHPSLGSYASLALCTHYPPFGYYVTPFLTLLELCALPTLLSGFLHNHVCPSNFFVRPYSLIGVFYTSFSRLLWVLVSFNILSRPRRPHFSL